jgi:hypothetical protein
MSAVCIVVILGMVFDNDTGLLAAVFVVVPLFLRTSAGLPNLLWTNPSGESAYNLVYSPGLDRFVQLGHIPQYDRIGLDR